MNGYSREICHHKKLSILNANTHAQEMSINSRMHERTNPLTHAQMNKCSNSKVAPKYLSIEKVQ